CCSPAPLRCNPCAPPGSPGFDPSVYNPAYITALYYGVLNRAPDQSGFNFWVGELNKWGN
ncbi:MAG TPA: hypothetical protein DC047_01615, partial [Blastocatellia bacterium]|nr:hypothetical protein [Blastocatellia bacterium]